MKKLNLNIELKTPVLAEDGKTEMKGYDVAIRWIGVMIERALNKPDQKTMRPTTAVDMNTQRKYFRVMNALDGHKEGIIDMEDDDFNFLHRKFNQAVIPAQQDIAEILVKVDDLLNKAKIEKKEGEK